MIIYLDMCCFNRPFDDQSQAKIQLETEAKLLVQQQIKDGKIRLVWSYMLEYENSANPDTDRSQNIACWKHLASITVEPTLSIPERATAYQGFGIGAKDALHIACAVEAGAECFLTVDMGILKRRGKIPAIKIVSPLEFFDQED